MSLTEFFLSPAVLAVIFFLIAFSYSAVGLGGGSAYTALMVLLGLDHLTIPILSLSLNLVVTSAGSFNFIRNRHARWQIVLPFLMGSMPMAYVGGALNLPAQGFYWVLLVSLALVLVRLFIPGTPPVRRNTPDTVKFIIAMCLGGALGLIAGIVGIGGGVYLVPLIIVLGLGTEKQAAASGAIFVWLNSVVGLVSRWQHNPVDLWPYLPMMVAVAIGGFTGSYLGASRLSARAMERLLAGIIVIAIVLLARKMLLA